MNDEAVCRTAPATPGLSNTFTVKPVGSWNFKRMFTPHHMSQVICHMLHVTCHVSHVFSGDFSLNKFFWIFFVTVLLSAHFKRSSVSCMQAFFYLKTVGQTNVHYNLELVWNCTEPWTLATSDFARLEGKGINKKITFCMIRGEGGPYLPYQSWHYFWTHLLLYEEF